MKRAVLTPLIPFSSIFVCLFVCPVLEMARGHCSRRPCKEKENNGDPEQVQEKHGKRGDGRARQTK